MTEESQDYAKLIHVIETTNVRRGNGETTPIRAVTQYWSLEGELLAESDPCPDSETELREIDSILRNRSALDGLNGRVEKIRFAIEAAAKVRP